MMGDGIERIHEKIKSFQRKYYLNIFVRGIILTLASVLGYFLMAVLIEHNLWLSHWARTLIFFSFIVLVVGCFYLFLKEPFRWWIIKRGLNEEQSAVIIGKHLPHVSDRLLNLLQLSATPGNDLRYASMLQKSKEFEPLQFDSIVNIAYNKKYLKFLLLPIALIVAIFIFNQRILTESTNRIIHFNQKYSPKAPFTFTIENQPLIGFYNEDFTIHVTLAGDAIPENLYLDASNRVKLERITPEEFQYTFQSIQHDIDFQLEGAGFFSTTYHITVANRPEVTRFTVQLEYPRYIQRANETLSNTGNLQIPEGTNVHWILNTTNAEQAIIVFDNNQKNYFKLSDNQNFTFKKVFKNSQPYQINLNNKRISNKEKILYNIEVIKDQYPTIAVNNLQGSVLYRRVILGGMINDDYGLTKLNLHFNIKDENQKELLNQSIALDISAKQLQQNFFYNWSLDSIKLKPGQQLEYFLEVFDNDGVNGSKSTRSAKYNFQIPSENDLLTNIDGTRNKTQRAINESATKADKLHDKIQQAEQKLKGKQNLDWQDKKMLDDIVQQKENLEHAIEQLKEQNEMLQQKKDAFTEQDKRIKEKSEQIQKLMNQLLDEETKKLFDELQKLLKENADPSQIQKLMDKLNQKSDNLEKDLDRMLELFKQVEFETKLDLAIEKLKQQIDKQNTLLDRTESLDKKGDKKNTPEKNQKKDDGDATGDKNPDDTIEQLAREQEQLNSDFEKTSEKIEELKMLEKELNKNDELPPKETSDQIQKDQKESKESLQQNNTAKSKTSQEKVVKEMKAMKDTMEGMQSSMEMEMDMQNLESLRQIIHGMIKLSFDQENLIKGFEQLQQSDPRFNTLAQQQLKLKDDAKVLEDSLIAVSKKDPSMGSFITKEIGELNNHLDKVNEANSERKRPQAANEMQLSMTSINNLALMLDSHYDMMMQMMANAQPSMKKSKQKGKKPSLSEMQQQLNQKIQELKKSGKDGRQLSEELANAAAEQERIRRALEEMQDKMKKEGKSPGGDLPSKMEQTELDLVNKSLTDQMIKRQKDILTRLLETENAMREQEQDEKRKGETAKDYENELPKAFEEYLRLKQKEVEILRSVPPKLYPYYKKEVGEYFKRTDK
jgi:hypothetical protein